MRLLKLYVLKQFLYAYLLTIASLVGVFLVVDFFERVDEFLAKGAAWADLLAYYLYKIPFIIFFMGPQSVLLATVIALVSLSRHNEFTAMKACGIGITGITMPIVLAAAGISLLVIACNEYIAPNANKQMNQIFNVKVRGRLPSDNLQRDKIWFISANGWVWNIGYYDPSRSAMRGVSIFIYGDGHYLRRRIDSPAVTWNGKEWEFLNGYTRDFLRDGVKTAYFEKTSYLVPETPEFFTKTRKQPEEMSLSELYAEIQAEAAEGRDTTRQQVDLQYKISYPFISVVLALIGIPLSLRSSRAGGLLFAVGISLAMGFVFSFIYAMGISLGRGGAFSPFLAGWGVNALFAAAGFYFLLTVDSDRLLPFGP